MTDQIKIDPYSEFSFAINITLADWEEHVIAFLEKAEYSKTSMEDVHVVKELIRSPLLAYWTLLPHNRQLDLKRSLQYLLTRDKDAPYKNDVRNNSLRSKQGCLAQKIRDSCQSALTPFDGYILCKWMWEVLFGNEEWNVDISKWLIFEKTIDI
jgi:hypothetical protein